MKTLLTFLLLTTTCLIWFAIASAQTTDGVTPADEKVCDVLLNGVTDNLFGICNAYCEAKDCDTLPKLDKSCTQLLNNFQQRAPKGLSMPCEDENMCIDRAGRYYTNPVKDCRLVKEEKLCSISFQPFRECERITGNDTIGCVWAVSSCRIGGLKEYCCEDSVEKYPDPLDIRIQNEAYDLEPLQ